MKTLALSLAALALVSCTAATSPATRAAADAGCRRAEVTETKIGPAAFGCDYDDAAAHRVRGYRDGVPVTVTVCCGPNRPGGCEILDELD